MNNNNRGKIGRRIKDFRKQKDLTQAAFAEKIGRDRSLISKLEAGEVELSPSIQLTIYKVFAVRKDWLLTGKGEMYDDRWPLLEKRAADLGEDIALELATLKATTQAHRELLEALRIEGEMAGRSDLEKEYVNKLSQIFKYKDEGTIKAITQNIDTFLRVPDKKNAKKRA